MSVRSIICSQCSKKEFSVRHPIVRMFAHFLACFVAIFSLSWFG